MGLDAYLMVTENADGYPADDQHIWYARKNWAVQHWMAHQYDLLHPKERADFNCQNLYLNQDLLDQLKADFVTGTLLGSSGHFSELSDYEKDSVLLLLSKAERALSEGYGVYYTSWY